MLESCGLKRTILGDPAENNRLFTVCFTLYMIELQRCGKASQDISLCGQTSGLFLTGRRILSQSSDFWQEGWEKLPHGGKAIDTKQVPTDRCEFFEVIE